MSFRLKEKVIFFATNNINKFNEACMVMAEYGIAVGMLRVKTMEIQSESLEKIAVTSVFEAFRKCNLPIIVEDAGLFVEELNGFPGPYAAYVYKTIGNEGLLKLIGNADDRRAQFRSVVAYKDDSSKSPVCFFGDVVGEITCEETRRSGKGGFGFDPVFRPIESDKTFAEMDVTEKNRYSHRAKALRQFAKWYKNW